jgi:hypothetical protein
MRHVTAIVFPLISSMFAASACSTFVTRFPEPTASGEDCVGQYFAPTADMALGVGSIVLGTAMLGPDLGEAPFEEIATAMALTAVALGVYGVVSGSYGFSAVGACQQQRDVQAAKVGSADRVGPGLTRNPQSAEQTTLMGAPTATFK